MLESIRQNSRSAIIYILFGILIAAFVVSFGPGSPTGDSILSSLGGKYAAKVSGHEITEQEFHYVYVYITRGDSRLDEFKARQLREAIMDRMIERELFANQAEQMGLLVSEDEAATMVAGGKMYVAGTVRPIEGYAFRAGALDYDRFRMVIQNSYRITVKQFMEIQKREILADKLRQMMKQGAKVSLEEVKLDFEDRGRQINLEYVRFSPYRYEAEIVPTDTDIENYARSNEDKLKKLYEERKFMYQKQDRTAHLRRILIDVKKDATDAQVAEARTKIEAAQKTLGSGTKFADVARTVSEDQATKSRGGDVGWRKKGTTDFGPEVEAKVFAAKEGDLVGPERTERGLELIRVEGFREGDIGFGQARSELAEEQYRTERAKELAQKAAQEAADKLKAGGKLADLYPKDNSDAAEAMAKGTRLQAEETGLFARRGDVVQGIGASDAMSKAVWKLKTGEWVGPVEVSGSFIVASLKDKKDPDLTDFDKRKDELVAEYGRGKSFSVLADWARTACIDSNTAGKIKVNQDILASEDAPRGGPKNPFTDRKYEPCRERQF